MRQIGLRVAHALDDRQLVLLPQGDQTFELRVQTGAAVDAQDIVGLDADRVAQLVVGRVGVGDQGVEPVVAAFELDQHQHAVGR